MRKYHPSKTFTYYGKREIHLPNKFLNSHSKCHLAISKAHFVTQDFYLEMNILGRSLNFDLVKDYFIHSQYPTELKL